MSDEQKDNAPTLTIDGLDYAVKDLSGPCQIHYVQVLKLRQKVVDLQNHCIEAEEDLVDARIALGWREQALRESVAVVDDENGVES